VWGVPTWGVLMWLWERIVLAAVGSPGEAEVILAEMVHPYPLREPRLRVVLPRHGGLWRLNPALPELR
jgi:hypothetical protein